MFIAEKMRSSDVNVTKTRWPERSKLFESMKVVKRDTMSIVNLFKAKYIFELALVFANVMYLGSSVPAFLWSWSKKRRGPIRNRRKIFVVMRHCRLFV